MGTATPVARAEVVGESPAVAFLRRLARWLWPPNAELATVNEAEVPVLTLMDRFRKFLWLSSGLFSAAAFAVPAVGVMVYGTFEGGGTSFLAAVISACLFGVTTFLNFGPDEA
ncbi:MAG TPA: hypothetical protein VK189_08955 [Thermoplasmata archaeon]|nr:hypothetical protein [Thermoplasmata archaeon]